MNKTAYKRGLWAYWLLILAAVLSFLYGTVDLEHPVEFTIVAGGFLGIAFLVNRWLKRRTDGEQDGGEE